MQKILISCCTGIKNSGDEAILQSMLQSFKSIKDLQIKTFSLNPDYTKKFHNITSFSHSIFKHPIQTFKAIRWCDVFILGGGGLLQDETSLFNVPFWLSKIIIASLLKKKIYIYAISIGPVKHNINRKLIKLAINKADIITLRDIVSKDFLKEWGINDPKIKLTSDAAFGLKVSEENKRLTELNHIPKKKFVIVFLRHWYDQFPIIPVRIAVKYNLRTRKNKKKFESLTNEFCKTVKFLNENMDLDILFISMCFGRDQKIAGTILKKTNSHRNTLIDKFIHPYEIIQYIKKAELVIGMRLHSLIYAIIAKKAFVSISYSLKNKAFLRSIGMREYGIDIDKFSSDKLNEIIKKTILNKKTISHKLNHIFADQKNKNVKNLEILTELLNNE